MKKICMLIVSFLSCVLPCLAQKESGQNGWQKFMTERLVFDIQASLSARSVTNIASSVDIGTRLNRRLYAFVSYGKYWMLYSDDAGQRHCSTDLMGGGMGFRCFEMSSVLKSVDVRLKVEQSVGGRSMTCTVYDVGVHGRLGGSLLVPTVGLGFRHAHLHTAGLSHQNYVYLSIGIGL